MPAAINRSSIHLAISLEQSPGFGRARPLSRSRQVKSQGTLRDSVEIWPAGVSTESRRLNAGRYAAIFFLIVGYTKLADRLSHFLPRVRQGDGRQSRFESRINGPGTTVRRDGPGLLRSAGPYADDRSRLSEPSGLGWLNCQSCSCCRCTLP